MWLVLLHFEMPSGSLAHGQGLLHSTGFYLEPGKEEKISLLHENLLAQKEPSESADESRQLLSNGIWLSSSTGSSDPSWLQAAARRAVLTLPAW